MLTPFGAGDVRGVRRLRKLPHAAPVDRALVGMSRATDHSDAWLVVGLVGAAIDRRRRSRWLDAGARIALVELSSRAIKRALPRDRPQLDGLPPLATTPSPMSFPSSHTAASVAALYAFDGLIPRRLLQTIVLLTAFSRLYLGVHFPSDVVAVRPSRGGDHGLKRRFGRLSPHLSRAGINGRRTTSSSRAGPRACATPSDEFEVPSGGQRKWG